MKPIVKTNLGDISLRRASLDDADLVQKIMLDAAQIPLTRGLDMWGWVGTPTGEDIIRRRITQDEVYIAALNDQPIATLTVQWSDSQTWGDAGNDGAAGYVHGLAVLREHMGNGIGKSLVAWAAERIGAEGKRLLRLDCMGENSQLCRYYEKDLGLRAIGIREGNGWSAKLFEKEITPHGGEADPQE
jgi:GNAT superfamily N-acetyltransferase